MKRFWNRLLAWIIAAVLVCAFAVPAFAYDPNNNGTVIIPEGVTSLSNGSIPKTPSNVLNVKTVYVPSSVKTIGARTFTGFVNLRNVVIKNDRANVTVDRNATSGSTRIIYSGAPAATTTHVATTNATQDPLRATSRWNRGSTKAADRWVEELQGQQQTTENDSVSETQPQTITVTDENGEIMITIPGEADKPNSDSQGSTGMRALSWVLVGLAIVSAVVLLWAKFKKK